MGLLVQRGSTHAYRISVQSDKVLMVSSHISLPTDAALAKHGDVGYRIVDASAMLWMRRKVDARSWVRTNGHVRSGEFAPRIPHLFETRLSFPRFLPAGS